MSPVFPRVGVRGFSAPRRPPFMSRSALGRMAAAHAIRYNIGSAITAVTGTTADDTLTKTGHGLPNGASVVLSALVQANPSAGVRFAEATKGGLFVINAAANTFQLAFAPGGPALDLGSDVTSVTVQRVGSSVPFR